LFLSIYGPRAIVLLQWVDEPLELYELEISHTHTYLIGNAEILVHNIILPAAALAGQHAITLTGSLAPILSCVRPTVVVTGLVVAGRIGLALDGWSNRKMRADGFLHYYQDKASDAIMTRQYYSTDSFNGHRTDKAPGMPTADDGYISQKMGWAQKRLMPNGEHRCFE
jgi:hypothetical protein